MPAQHRDHWHKRRSTPEIALLASPLTVGRSKRDESAAANRIKIIVLRPEACQRLAMYFARQPKKAFLSKAGTVVTCQMRSVMIPVPKELVWDYREAPQDILWRLQRIADFFPLYGNNRETVELLYRHRDELRLDGATRALIEEYHHAWEPRPS
jgi:hypothetical protein